MQTRCSSTKPAEDPDPVDASVKHAAKDSEATDSSASAKAGPHGKENKSNAAPRKGPPRKRCKSRAVNGLKAQTGSSIVGTSPPLVALPNQNPLHGHVSASKTSDQRQLDDDNLLSWKCGILDVAEAGVIAKGLEQGVGLVCHRGKKIYLDFYQSIQHGTWNGVPCLLRDGKAIVTTSNVRQLLDIAYNELITLIIENDPPVDKPPRQIFCSMLDRFLDMDVTLFMSRSQWWELRSFSDRVRLSQALQTTYRSERISLTPREAIDEYAEV